MKDGKPGIRAHFILRQETFRRAANCLWMKGLVWRTRSHCDVLWGQALPRKRQQTGQQAVSRPSVLNSMPNIFSSRDLDWVAQRAGIPGTHRLLRG